MSCFGPVLQITVGSGYDGVCCDLTTGFGLSFPLPVPPPRPDPRHTLSRSSSEADSFEFGTQDSQTAWRTATLESISGSGKFQGSHWGARPCTSPLIPGHFCTLQLSGPLLPCVHSLGTGGDREEGNQVLFLLKDPPALHLEAGAICDSLWVAYLMPFKILGHEKSQVGM